MPGGLSAPVSSAALLLAAAASFAAAQETPSPFKMPGKIEHRGGTPKARSMQSASTPTTVAPDASESVPTTVPTTTIELRAALHVESHRATAAAALWSLQGSDKTPVDEKAADATAVLLGAGFARFESAHVVMLSDASTERVHARLGTLELARTAFLKWASRTGLNPAPEPTKHLCILFAERNDYIAFARQHDALDASNLGGHYSPSRERMVLYADAPGLPPSDGLTTRSIHEAVHMVAFRTTAQTRRRTQPFWLTEGLASAFEPTDEAPLAPDAPKPTVRERFLQARQIKNATIPLDTLVALTSPPREDPAAGAAMYRTSEALLRYLARHRKRELAIYMESLTTGEPGKRTPAELRDEFVARFGEPAAIEREMTLRPW
jgi:hypothetical protein